MKIAVIGPGSMGLLYATKLSTVADVMLLGNNKTNIDLINQNGITVKRGDSSTHYNVPAHLNGTYTEAVDLVIMFTKAYITRQALADNKAIIGQNTVVMTLQNGAGHESVLQEFAPADSILIGTTAQGSYRENAHTIVNSGLLSSTGTNVFYAGLLWDEAKQKFTECEEYSQIVNASPDPEHRCINGYVVEGMKTTVQRWEWKNGKLELTEQHEENTYN